MIPKEEPIFGSSFFFNKNWLCKILDNIYLLNKFMERNMSNNTFDIKTALMFRAYQSVENWNAFVRLNLKIKIFPSYEALKKAILTFGSENLQTIPIDNTN